LTNSGTCWCSGMDLEQVLKQVQKGELAVDQAALIISGSGEADLGFAKVDTDRPRRRGMPEAIFCPGKTNEQIIKVMAELRKREQDVLATRVTPEQYAAIRKAHPAAVYHEAARIVTIDSLPRPEPVGLIAVVCAGTCDMPVAEEAAVTAERMGARVERVYDVGVAGLHRLLRHLPLLKSARAVIVVAGMEGALPSVAGGMIDKPIIAVPTSIGYGTGMQGLAALLAMLNSCVPGIAVVNVDNGFGAGVAAAMINRTGEDQV
jgi:NCAIR mutase (PurE)-related protein